MTVPFAQGEEAGEEDAGIGGFIRYTGPTVESELRARPWLKLRVAKKRAARGQREDRARQRRSHGRHDGDWRTMQFQRIIARTYSAMGFEHLDYRSSLLGPVDLSPVQAEINRCLAEIQAAHALVRGKFSS